MPALAGIFVLVLGACTSDDGVDYCKNHYVFHPDHASSVARLSIEVSANGNVSGELRLQPSTASDLGDDDLRRLLQSPGRVFLLQSAEACEMNAGSIGEQDGDILVKYAAHCGEGNKLGQVDVALFDHLPGLDEIVVRVRTPAAAKRFAISRQCDHPIFRLD